MTKGQKIFLGVSLAGLLLGTPLLLWTQGPAECCRLSQDITVKDFTYMPTCFHDTTYSDACRIPRFIHGSIVYDEPGCGDGRDLCCNFEHINIDPDCIHIKKWCTEVVGSCLNFLGFGCFSNKDNRCDFNCSGVDPDCKAGFVPGSVTFHKNTVIGAGDLVGSTKNFCNLKGEKTLIQVEFQEWGTVCLLNSIYNVTNWIFFFFLAIAILVGVIAGYYFMTSAGDERKLEKGRSLLTYMAIGLIVAAITKVLPTLVRTIIGV